MIRTRSPEEAPVESIPDATRSEISRVSAYEYDSLAHGTFRYTEFGRSSAWCLNTVGEFQSDLS